MTDADIYRIAPLVYKVLSQHLTKATAIKNQDICERLQLYHNVTVKERDVRVLIHHLRVHCTHSHYPVGNHCGYWVTNDKREIEEYGMYIRGRIESETLVLNSVRTYYKNVCQKVA